MTGTQKLDFLCLFLFLSFNLFFNCVCLGFCNRVAFFCLFVSVC